MGLSKPFDRVPHNLLVPKPNAYGLPMDALTFTDSHVKRRKQGVNQEPNLGAFLFNIIVDLLFFIN